MARKSSAQLLTKEMEAAECSEIHDHVERTGAVPAQLPASEADGDTIEEDERAFRGRFLSMEDADQHSSATKLIAANLR